MVLGYLFVGVSGRTTQVVVRLKEDFRLICAIVAERRQGPVPVEEKKDHMHQAFEL